MKQEKKAVCTIAMIVINITIFLVLSFQGMTEDGIFMFHHGAMYVPSMLEDGEYYRLFTSMFLHLTDRLPGISIFRFLIPDSIRSHPI